MAPPKPKAVVKPAAAPAGGVKKAKVGKPRNYDLGNGVVRFSKSKMFHKKVSRLPTHRFRKIITLKLLKTMLSCIC